MNNERHLTYFQFLISWKTIESGLKDLNYTLVLLHLHKNKEKIWMDGKLISLSTPKAFCIHHPRSLHRHILGLNCLVQNNCANYLGKSWAHFGEVGTSTPVECALPG